MILHIINKSPRSHSCFSECLNACTFGSSMLFIEDGVYASRSLTSKEQQKLKDKDIQLYALEADIQARGLSKEAHEMIKTVNDKGFVELIASHHSSQSWY